MRKRRARWLKADDDDPSPHGVHRQIGGVRHRSGSANDPRPRRGVGTSAGAPAGSAWYQHGDLTLQLRVGGLIDLSHAALADEGGHVVVAEWGAAGEGHELFKLVCGSFYAQAVYCCTHCTEIPQKRVHTHSDGVQQPLRWVRVFMPGGKAVEPVRAL